MTVCAKDALPDRYPPEANSWNNVKDKLPPFWDDVLVIIQSESRPNFRYDICYFANNLWKKLGYGYISGNSGKVTYWMGLPKFNSYD